MRLKILFFPIVMLLVIYISIMWIWPMVTKMETVKIDLEQKNNELQEILKKKGNIDLLKNTLNQNKDKEQMVISYLPNDKNEEKIINNVYNMTTSAGVILINMSLEEMKPSVAEQQNSGSISPIISSSDISGQTDMAPIGTKNEVKIIKARINVAGSYEYIKIFLDQLKNSGMHINIASALISQQENLAAKEGENTNNLTAKIEADFGYLPQTKAKIDLKSTLDFSVVDKISSAVAKSATSIELDSVGKVNPFLP